MHYIFVEACEPKTYLSDLHGRLVGQGGIDSLLLDP